MSAERVPVEIYSLAEMLCDELVARGWKTADCTRRFDNGLPQSVNLLALNFLMLGQNTPAPASLIFGLSNALGVSEDFLRRMDVAHDPHWLCPEDVLSMDQRDFLA